MSYAKIIIVNLTFYFSNYYFIILYTYTQVGPVLMVQHNTIRTNRTLLWSLWLSVCTKYKLSLFLSKLINPYAI